MCDSSKPCSEKCGNCKCQDEKKVFIRDVTFELGSLRALLKSAEGHPDTTLVSLPIEFKIE